jgi:hypothetical protein
VFLVFLVFYRLLKENCGSYVKVACFGWKLQGAAVLSIVDCYA